MALDLEQMAIYATVVREGSFTAAARALGAPKSTVSKRVAELEQRLGVRLLHRSTRRMRMTEEGTAYYERCARIVTDAEHADREIVDRDATPRGIVRMTAPVAAAPIVSSLVAEFLRAYPNVSLEVVLVDRRVDLIAEGFDLAIRTGPLRDSALVSRRLTIAERCVCAHPSYLAGRPRLRRPADLRAHECIGLRAGTAARIAWSFERRGREIEVEVSGRYVVSSPQLARDGAIAGLGIVNLPRFMLHDDLATGRVVEVLASWRPRPGELHALYPSGRQLSPRVRALVDTCVAHFQGSSSQSPASRVPSA
jgi:DNA-binding transcriptional LysR family regulator